MQEMDVSQCQHFLSPPVFFYISFIFLSLRFVFETTPVDIHIVQTFDL